MSAGNGMSGPTHHHGSDATPAHHTVVRTIKHDLNDRPFIVIWEVTRACALACRHCRAEAMHHPDPRQLTHAESLELLDQLASYEPPRPMVVFTGGDPFERDDLVDLVRYGTEKGLHISLSPSVTPKLRPALLQELHEAGGRAMSVSLDGATPERHDAFRGFSGTFEATVQAAQWIKEAGFRLQINTTLTRGNIREAPQMLKNAIDMGAFMWYTLMLVPTGRGAQLEMLSPEEREDVLNWLHDESDRIAIKTTEAPQYRRIAIQRQRLREAGVEIPEQVAHRGELYEFLTTETERLLGGAPENPRPPRPPLAVNSGSGFAFIDNTGDVYPNGFLPIHCGSIKDTPFAEIYRNSEVFQQLRNPDGFEGKCGVCEFNRICGGSRAISYAITGDYLASDPTCAWIPPQWAQ